MYVRTLGPFVPGVLWWLLAVTGAVQTGYPIGGTNRVVRTVTSECTTGAPFATMQI